jgi:hypothetical protein
MSYTPENIVAVYKDFIEQINSDRINSLSKTEKNKLEETITFFNEEVNRAFLDWIKQENTEDNLIEFSNRCRKLIAEMVVQNSLNDLPLQQQISLRLEIMIDIANVLRRMRCINR